MHKEFGKKKKKSGAGFTLIELLAVIIVVVSVGYVITAILVSSLRGTNKTNTIDKVRANGTYAISQMSRMIEFAQKFDGVSTDGATYITNCSIASVGAGTPTPTPLPSQYSYVKITSFDGGQTTFSCSTPIASVSASATVNLIDTSTVSLVPGSCYFTCSQDSVALPPTIGINFSLLQKVTANFSENQATIPFSTSVSMRNF